MNIASIATKNRVAVSAATIALAATVFSGAGTATAAPASTTTKTNYGGLFTASESDRTSYSPDLNGYWLKVNWSALEPSAGTFDFSSIDSYLTAHPGVNVRLHVNGGADAPQWLKTAAGSVVVKNSRSSNTVTVGRYWTPTYTSAFTTAANALGARYNAKSAIASINDFANSLAFDEPFIMGGDPGSITTLYNAGLNQTTQKAAITGAIASLTKAFPNTVVEIPAHSQLTYPTATGQGSSWTAGRDLLNQLDTTYGTHLIVTDYGWGPGDYTPAQPLTTATNEYAWMHQRATEGRPIAFQATLTGAGQTPTPADAVSATNDAIHMGASWFEHSSWSLLTDTQVHTDDTALKNNVG